ncbi:ABC transporter ATP-binding protein [Fodinicola acaciae]|uniref:ABC transporter ATP-binding protein n=1 Tax=Fodinicola acaciae TaxID=2681555 RepID=UPI0013D4FEC4|nr:ABC transporter ATP-binding protein [Fodinicola acaciae]
MTIIERLDTATVPAAVSLCVNDLGFCYRGAADDVLTGVGFDLTAGEVLGILGPNGSGKSTLLKALLDAQSGVRTGRVTTSVHGDAVELPRVVGFASQHIALYQQLTVWENLRHSARVSVPWRQVGDAVDRTIAEFGLEQVIRVPVEKLSGGWQRLAHIAASFVHSPPIRLLDEPTAALDFEARGRLVELIGQWRRQRMAMIVTSHYPEDIEETCTHAVVLRGGTIVRRGTLAALLGGLDAELVLEVDVAGVPATVRAPAPVTAADLSTVVASLVRDKEISAARLTAARLTRKTLRQLMVSDPELRGLLDDDQSGHPAG